MSALCSRDHEAAAAGGEAAAALPFVLTLPDHRLHPVVNA
jgi:hypothetical protein